MKRSTRLVSIKGKAMMIFQAPECISDDIVKYQDFWEWEIFNRWKPSFDQALFDRNSIILDIGANIGSHTLQFKYYYPTNPIWAFELHHENFSLLKQNLAEYNDVKCFNVGVGSKTSIIQYNDGHFSNCGVVRLDAQGGNHNIVLALDDLKDNALFSNRISLIKIDIEGHELSAFEGMRKLITQHKPMIWLEDLSSDKHAVAFLKTLGYQVIRENIETDDYLMIKN